MGTAQAHKLKVFATVEGGVVRGYAFFIGGGRAAATPWIAHGATGGEIASGETDAEGRFDFRAPPPASEVTVTVDTREGHIASASLPAARFGGAAPAGGTSDPAADGRPAAVTQQPVAVMVEEAVQHQLTPLMERIEQLDARLRFTDMVSGVFLILGLAGMAIWARGRRR
ncbi:cobalamin biosynthesis protein CbiL (plasmid) [Roseomonas marmotae]|uniref:Cobalamin biosynthesis protein CbiL n=2 Tax=Roseomonas marmotae TaxID=2768161 RepID=A0ABS3KGR6_9PROT|nr:cobalamin biosynthesis protein CbiL [Roseomonas marmotae]QTI81736.1 cobalamin biosynthesis protein CbiL [Roseomonas marmotae]